MTHQPKPSSSTETNQYNWEKYTLLIAEDQITNFKILEAYLRRTNARILWAKTGDQAIQLCKDRKDICLVLMDINIPIIDGLEATKKIKQFRPELPIIAQTAYAMPGDRENSLNSGCSDYIAKPIRREELLEMIRNYLP